MALRMKVLLNNYLYATESKQTILPGGSITSETYPWLGYSPDCVIVNNLNELIKLIVIKCPFIGNAAGLLDLIKQLKYIIRNAEV